MQGETHVDGFNYFADRCCTRSSMASTFLMSVRLYSIILSMRSGSYVARIWTASSAAFLAPLIARLPTGTPPGI